MISRLQPVRISRFAFVFLLVASMMLASLPCPAQTYDWQESDGPQGGAVYALGQAPGGNLYAGLKWVGGIFRSTDQGATWQEVGLRGENVSGIVINNAGAVFVAVSNGDVHRSLDNGGSWPISGSNLVGTNGSLAYDPVLDILYAAKSGLLSRSVDGGDTWESVSTNFPSVQVYALAAAPNGGPLFVGTQSNKVFRSLDVGVTWNPFDSGYTVNRVRDFLIVPEGDIYAASGTDIIFRATWDGTTWSQLGNGLENRFCMAIDRDETGRLWTGTNGSGPYVSSDGGLNWVPSGLGMEVQKVRAFLFIGANDFLAGCDGGGVFRSGDAGTSWTLSSGGLNHSSPRTMVITGNGTLYAATYGAGVHRSTDNGATWNPINDGIEDPLVWDIVSHPDGDLFAGTWGTHIYRSQDGGDTWGRTGTTPNITTVACLAVKPSSGDLFSGGMRGGGVWRSTDKGDTWTPVNGGLTILDIADLVVEDDGDLLVATRGEGIFRSQNDGDNWTPLNNGLTDLNVDQVLSLPGGVLFAANSDVGLFRSLDDGETWELVDASLDEPSILTVAVNANGFLFAGAQNNNRIYQSTDGGDSWFIISDSFPQANIRSLAFDSSGRLLVGTSGLGIIFTQQSTPVFLQDFIAVRSGSGIVTVRWSVSYEGLLWAGEIFRSVDGSAQEQLSFGMMPGGPSFEFLDTAAPSEPCDYWLRLTDADGTYSWYGPIRVERADSFTSRLSILGIWPNPTAGSTTIRFSVPPDKAVRLDVYDLRGRLVRRLRRGVAGSANLETAWDVRDDRGARVPSGTYFLRLSAGNLVVTGKVVVLGR